MSTQAAATTPVDAPESPVAGPVDAPVDENVEICPNCAAPRVDTSVMWCRKCGFNPALGRVIDLAGDDLDRERPEEEASDKPSATKGVALMCRMTPSWVRRSGMAAVVAGLLGVFARMGTEPDSLERLVCALGLLLSAALTIGIAHLWAFFYAVPESDRVGIVDLFVRPFHVWSPTMRDVDQPGVWRRPALLIFGIVAAVVGFAVVGGIPWERIWELGPAEPAKKKLQDAIENVGKEPDSNQTAGPANIDPAKPRADCVVIGYIPAFGAGLLDGTDKEIDFSSLVLAADVRGRLRYVGVVASGIPSEERAAIRKRLPDLTRARPILPCGVSATWVDPVIACRVAYDRITLDNRLDNLKYEKLLAELPGIR